MKNPYDTEDMVQNTFIRLMKNNPHFDSVEHEKSWLIRTAINLCKDHFKSWWSSKTIHTDKLPEMAGIHYSFTQDETLAKVLDLPSKYKTAIYMYYYEGYSSVDIARTLGKKEATIRGYLAAGRKRLKLEMEGDFQ
jgi:RNA polymerase sigma-70 factor (ECF subfamily)